MTNDREAVVYLRDLDGTGSLHVCAEGDPGAIEFVEARAYCDELVPASEPSEASRIDALLRSLLKGQHTSLTIGFNDLHACNYDTAAEWSEQMGEADGGMQTYNDLRDWVSPEEREKALRDNTVWSIQWYPDTPVGFCQLYASSLETLIAALKAAEQE